MSNSEFSVDAVRKHQETVMGALKVRLLYPTTLLQGVWTTLSNKKNYAILNKINLDFYNFPWINANQRSYKIVLIVHYQRLKIL
jgi:hypothetical protein